MSAWNCISSSLSVMPPSTRSASRLTPESVSLARITGRVVADAVRDGREEAAPRANRRAAGIQQQEASGAVRVLRLAGPEAGLSDEGRLLIAEDAADRDAVDRLDARLAVLLAA